MPLIKDAHLSSADQTSPGSPVFPYKTMVDSAANLMMSHLQLTGDQLRRMSLAERLLRAGYISIMLGKYRIIYRDANFRVQTEPVSVTLRLARHRTY